MAEKKKVKIAKDTKQGNDDKKAKDAKDGKTSGKTLPDNSLPPTSTQDPNAKLARRKSQGNVISTFQGQLDMTSEELEKEQMKTVGKIRLLRKDNDRIQRKQEAEFGMTLDLLEELKITLEKTKTSNQKLYGDMEESKNLHDKLERQLNASKQKFKDSEALIEQFQRDTKVWDDTNHKLSYTEARNRDLREANKKLRFMLVSHHIDPHADARLITTKQPEEKLLLKSNNTFPSISTRKLTNKGMFKIAGELNKIRSLNDSEIKRNYGISRAHLDQVSPAYLGYYLKRRRRSVEPLRNNFTDIPQTSYRTGVTLPKLNIRQFDRLTLE